MAPKDESIPTGRVARTAKVGTVIGTQGARYAGTRAANVVRSKERATEALDQRHLDAAERMVDTLGTMKGAAMKIGQLASFIDTEFLPPEYREALYEEHVARRVLCFEVRLADGDGRCIGEAYLADLTWPRASGELCVAIFSPDDRRQGYGTEAATLVCAYAFDGLGLNRISLRFPVENVAATQATERAGPDLRARKVGVEREAEWVFGRHGDVAVWEVLRSDFPPHPATAELRTPPGEFAG